MILRLVCILILCLSFLQCKSAKATQVIENIGDFLQFLPAGALIYTLFLKDYEGAKELAIGFGSTMGVVLISKASLQAISKKNPYLVAFARRPNGSNFEGFPSGHTASAFSAVGFLQKRYGWKFSLPTAILATFVAYSRVQAQKHSVFQVVAGGILGFTISYLVASKYINPTKHHLALNSKKYINGETYYGVRYSYFF